MIWSIRRKIHTTILIKKKHRKHNFNNLPEEESIYSENKDQLIKEKAEDFYETLSIFSVLF